MHAPPVSQPEPPIRRPGAFPALSAPNFRLYLIGLVLYVIGYHAEYVSFAWLVWQLSHDPLFLGYLGIAQGVPVTLLQIFGGVFADRLPRLRLLMSSQLATGACVATAFVLTATGLVRVEHLLLLSALTSTFRAFDLPSRMAMVPELVERRHLANAVALGSIPWQSGRIVGPAIAGMLIAALSAAAGLGLSAGAYFLAIGLYSRIRIASTAPAGGGQGILRPLVEGFTFVARNSLFSSLTGLTFFNSFFGMSYVTVLPIFADQYFGAGSSGYGALQGVSGVGAVLGTVAIAFLSSRLPRRGKVLLCGGAGTGLALAVFSQSPSLLFALVALGLMGFTNTLYLTLVNTVIQEKVPDRLRGRVMAIYGMGWTFIPVGGILAGALAAALSARFAVLLGGTMVAALALLLLAFGRRLRAV
ncbi:MAG: MFS transporter [Chloroflexi bacterium]|nr:MFS transporter [Chloroflexota bacterium]